MYSLVWRRGRSVERPEKGSTEVYWPGLRCYHFCQYAFVYLQSIKTYSATTDCKGALQLAIDLAKTPRSDRTFLFLVVLFVQIVLFEQILRPQIQEWLELTHHPRKTDIRNLHVIVATTHIRVRTREPYLAERRPVTLRLFPDGG